MDGALSADPAHLATSPDERRALWEKRLARAQRTLDSYLESTRYPPESRPIGEHPDLVEPHHVEPSTVPLARKDDRPSDVRVTLRQDRFFLVGDERATLLVTCETTDGPVPCELLAATAAVPPTDPGAGVRPAVPIDFAPAPDGSLRAELHPSTQGFADHHGTIRVSLELRVDGESGGASFDVQYTPTPPASFTGKVRESLQDGSLDLYLEMTIDRPGRYVITARADDAEGKSFAFLTFNEELGAGPREVRLRLFGKLVRDTAARSPFRLRDVEGFLLKENTFPDRELVPTLEGVVHTTKRYRDRDFSDSEWQSEERTRHIQEFTKDVEQARENAGN
ncbi:MAG: hypothetical protein IT372_06830 [Polyangiaceae bacterium]|nr:hypothetical protein [Polyangiaceae bacterium]